MLLTGSYTLGTTSNTDVFFDSAPSFYFGGTVLNAPDSDGFYWGLTGTALNPVYELGCYTGFSFKDKVTMNDIICDKTGNQGIIQKRDYIDIVFTLNSLLPLTLLSKVMRTGTVTTNASEHSEKMGVGDVTNKNTYFPAMWQKVYDPDTGDYLLFHAHRAQFVNAWDLQMPYANKWAIQLTMRCFADRTKPSNAWFGTFVRWDPSLL